MTRSAKQQRFGKCLLERVIGSGARSTVYLAWHEGLQIPVAVKVMRRVTGPQEAQSTERFVREARIAAQLSHPNIVRVYDCGEKGDSCYLVLEYIEGENCRDKLDQWGAFDWQRAIQIVRQVAEGLAYASRKGIIHRDLKPENIMIDSEGNARIADLGLAKEIVTHASSATQDGDVLGTPYYMSPEQIRQPSNVDFRADIYSLGATLYHMVVGEPPFDAATPFEIMAKHLNEPVPRPQSRRPDLPPMLCDIIMRTMAKDPGDRYPSYAELLKDLDRALENAQEAPAQNAEATTTSGAAAPLVPPAELAPAAPAQRVLRPVELPATGIQTRARVIAMGALLGHAALTVFLYQYVALTYGMPAATLSVALMLLVPAACAYAALRGDPDHERRPGVAKPDELREMLRRIAQSVGLPVPRLHLCPREDDAAFAYSLFSGRAIVHVPGQWLAQAAASRAEAEAFLAQAVAALYTGDSFLRTLLAAPVGALCLGRHLGRRIAATLAPPGRPLQRTVAQGLTLVWIVGACAALAALFFHSLWAGALGVAVLGELLLTAAFERCSRYGADAFAARVVSREAVESLLVLRGLCGPDARNMVEQCMGPEVAQAWPGHPLMPQERGPIVESAVAYFSEMQYSPDTLELGRDLFSVTPAPAERLNRLAGIGGAHSVLEALVSVATGLYARALGLWGKDSLSMRDLAPDRLSVLAGTAAGALIVAVAGLLYLRGSAGYGVLLGTLALLAAGLGLAVAPRACRQGVSAGRLAWALAHGAVAVTVSTMLGLCLLGSLRLSRYALQFPAGLAMTLLLSGLSAALYVRLGPATATGTGSSADPASSGEAEAGQEPDPAEDVLSHEPAQAGTQRTT